LGEGQIYYTFLSSYNLTPETVRNMPAYDVYMILAGSVAQSINDYHWKRQKKFKKGKGSKIPNITFEED